MIPVFFRQLLMARKSTKHERKTPDLKAAQILDGEWAVVSNDIRKPLTEAEANRIIAAYLAVNELLKSTV
jgi:hypothetical protein